MQQILFESVSKSELRNAERWFLIENASVLPNCVKLHLMEVNKKLSPDRGLLQEALYDLHRRSFHVKENSPHYKNQLHFVPESAYNHLQYYFLHDWMMKSIVQCATCTFERLWILRIAPQVPDP
jgi:hypothetical protein